MRARAGAPSGQARLYSDLAWTWPTISPPEEYRADGEFIAGAIKEHAPGEVRTLLDLGCGGGHLDSILKKHFEITGIDASSAMLSLARKLNPEAKYRLGDMRTVRLPQLFDAVLAYDSINYITTRQDLARVFRTAHRHLPPGGVFVTLVEESVETFVQHRTTSSTHKKGGLEITLIETHYDPDPSDSTYEGFLIFLLRRGKRLEVHTDHHHLGLFKLKDWHRQLRKTGFVVHRMYHDDGGPRAREQPYLVCTKKP